MRSPWILISLCMALSGCGQVWIKAGANDAALAADKQACQNEQEGELDSAIFEQCMANKGWWHPGAEKKAVVSDGTVPENDEKEKTVASNSSVQENNQESAQSLSSTDEKNPTPVSTNNNQQQTWIKRGRNNNLERDQKECRATSDNASSDEPFRWGESVTFDECMRAKGWRGS